MEFYCVAQKYEKSLSRPNNICNSFFISIKYAIFADVNIKNDLPM